MTDENVQGEAVEHTPAGGVDAAQQEAADTEETAAAPETTPAGGEDEAQEEAADTEEAAAAGEGE